MNILLLDSDNKTLEQLTKKLKPPPRTTNTVKDFIKEIQKKEIWQMIFLNYQKAENVVDWIIEHQPQIRNIFIYFINWAEESKQAQFLTERLIDAKYNATAILFSNLINNLETYHE